MSTNAWIVVVEVDDVDSTYVVFRDRDAAIDRAKALTDEWLKGCSPDEDSIYRGTCDKRIWQTFVDGYFCIFVEPVKVIG